MCECGGENRFCLWNPCGQEDSILTLDRCVQVPGRGIAQGVIFVVGEATEKANRAEEDNRGRLPTATGPGLAVPAELQ